MKFIIELLLNGTLLKNNKNIFKINLSDGIEINKAYKIIRWVLEKIYGHSIIWPKAYSEKLIIPFENVFKAYFKNIFIIL